MARPKIVSLAEAIGQINDGDMLTFGGFTVWRRPMAAIYELIRQKKRNLHLMEVNGGTHDDMLVGAGCVGVWESSWCGHELYGKFGGNLARKIENKEIFYEDWAHIHALYRLAAGAKGVPFLPTYSAMGSDILNPENDNLGKAGLRDGSNRHIGKHKVITYNEPFNNSEILLIPAAHPDWCITHVQMVGQEGTVRVDGLRFSDEEAIKASKHNIIIAEQVVPEEYLRREPTRNMLPGYFVDYIVELPWGAHPTGLYGAYEPDGPFISNFFKSTRTQEGFDQWAEEWVFGIKDHQEYLSKLGITRLEALRANPALGYSSTLKRG
ncbi:MULTISPECIES: acyl CoA--acetate/3-ketoacid CoA transferase subunit alpha [Desulfitobacterium]|uniref:Acyl CoA:acetate/3-ketoacid CoA transferase, alpha subunit n=2 Tax=Desulfitobacterium dehalogenans TaxID=36854 RepID=I4AD41_DESDJ|nr:MULTISPECIES: acyl CoA--acetate/3-ketoacid CoA transferase subunit alpha [Desulfitobacterium]AFM01876.1 acyl CoA:acetate/3-ketoacid CoA transferase, alpha subunit [Desulfitobacterium dehalogenans ATCC 51507]HHY26900.1 acyl CoA--acetate/3-ketoacid CoA transferase subunit alpha [Desulfitobacterium dehalogenans]